MSRRGSRSIVVIGLLLAACSHGSSPPVAPATVPAADVQAEALLQAALSAAAAYYVSGGTYVGFGDDASLLEPGVAWNRNPAAVVGQVSVRGESAQSVALVTKSTSGAVFCIGLSGMGGTTKGRQDAPGAAACSGGW